MENFLKISESNLSKAVEMWARAFYDGVFYVWIIPDPEIRLELLKEFFFFRLRLGVLYGDVYVTPNFEGGICWIPSFNALTITVRLRGPNSYSASSDRR